MSINEKIFKLSLVISLNFVVSCTGPGAPILRTSSSDGEGELIANCKNVSNTTKIDKYITNFYLSTWDSAVLEGAQQGVIESTSSDIINRIEEIIKTAGISTRPIVLTGINDGDILIQFLSRTSPYCRVYLEDSKKVANIISKIVNNLGNKIIISDVDNGIFITDFIKRQHNNPLSKAQWVDRYEIVVKNEGLKRTVVMIYRDLYISRDPGIYNQAISVGYNEGWIMTQISNDLLK